GRGDGVADGGEDGGEAVAVPVLSAVDAPVGADDVVPKRGAALGEAVPEPVGGGALVDPGDGVEQRPELVRFVLLQDGVDVEADRQADPAVLGVVDLHAAVAGGRPGLLGARPGGELAVVGDQLALGRGQADRVEVARAGPGAVHLQERYRQVDPEPSGEGA